MRTNIKKLVVAAAAALTFAAPSAFAARGDIVVYNNSDTTIAPYFKFDCFNTGWIFFGGIGGNGSFAWNDLVPDGCMVHFTYTVAGAPPPSDPVKGTLRTQFTFDSEAVQVIGIGTDVLARELEGPGEDGR